MALICASSMCSLIFAKDIEYSRHVNRRGRNNLRQRQLDESSISKGSSSKGSSKGSSSSGKGKGSKSSKSPGKGSKSSKSPGKGSTSSKSSKSPGKGKGKGGSSSSGKGKGGSSSSKGKGSSKNVPTAAPFSVPDITVAPTAAPVRVPTVDDICGSSRDTYIDRVKEILTDTFGPTDFEANTPQGDAFEWLTLEDKICPDNGTNDQIRQRYALATFYFSTDGDKWNFCDAKGTKDCPPEVEPFLSPANECEWYGVDECNANKKLTKLDFKKVNGQDVGLKGDIPSEIFVLPNLKDFIADFDGPDNKKGELTGDIPSNVGNAPKLAILDVEKHQLTGDIPASIYSSTTIREIDLDDNKLTGTISEDVANMKSLVFWSSNKNNFDDQSIPSGFATLTQNLKSLSLNNSKLIGDVPSSYGDLTKIEQIDFSDNKLTGEISFIENYTKAISIALDNNKFEGPVPDSVWSFPDLKFLILEKNELSGQLPSNIPVQTKLEVLKLGKNEFSGPIPASLANFKNLKSLDLSGNNFTGVVPDELCELKNLEGIKVDKNIACDPTCCIV